jgi:adenosylmethionine-8-amino-7-oxononanoate aminotransferase
VKLTELELKILQRVARREDPWRGGKDHAGMVSQAMQRLRRRGAVRLVDMSGPRETRHALTESGKAYLVEFCSHPGVQLDVVSGWWVCNVCDQRPPQTDVQPAGKISEPKA